MEYSDRGLEKIGETATTVLSPDFLREVFEGLGMSDDEIANALQIAGKMLSRPEWAKKLSPIAQKIIRGE